MILQRASELLASSLTGEISTRAICEAAGIGQPVLYRHFGDKDGLLAAVADKVWEEYLAPKRAAVPSGDPLQDLRDGWDNHLKFALAHPHAYKLVFASGLSAAPQAAQEAMALLESVLSRVAKCGRLRVSPSEAARVVMAANTGLALGLILRPTQFPDQGVSDIIREATLRGIVADAETGEGRTFQVAATTLLAGLPDMGLFTGAESALFAEWLDRLHES